MRKFKIDFKCGRSYPFALYVLRQGWVGERWEEVEGFETREKAKEFWEKIKDLPEYL